MLRGERRLLEEWLAAASRLPWWGGLVLAFVAFVMLHPFAIMETASAVDPDAVAIWSKVFWKGMADTAQYVAPVVCLVMPAVSAWVSRRRKPRG